MRKENGGNIEVEGLESSGSRIIVATPEEAREVADILLNNETDRRLVLVVDGALVQAQKNFAKDVEKRASEIEEKPLYNTEFRREWVEHDSKIAVEAGLFVAVLNKLVEAAGDRCDLSWESQVADRTANYKAFDIDKIDGAITSLGYIDKAVSTMNVEGATLIILNFDQMNYPDIGIKYNAKLAEQFVRVGRSKTNVLLFISPSAQSQD